MKFHLTHYNRNNRIIKSRREPHKEKETKISSSFNFHQSNFPYSNPSSLLVNPSQPNHKSKECIKTLPSEMYSIRTLSRFSKRKVSPSKFLLSKDRLPNGPPVYEKTIFEMRFNVDGGNFQKRERCRQAGSFIISSPGLMHRPQSRDARTYVTGFHKRWHILSRATPAIRWIRYACAGYDKIAGNDRRQEENICLVPFCIFFFRRNIS